MSGELYTELSHPSLFKTLFEKMIGALEDSLKKLLSQSHFFRNEIILPNAQKLRPNKGVKIYLLKNIISFL